MEQLLILLLGGISELLLIGYVIVKDEPETGIFIGKMSQKKTPCIFGGFRGKKNYMGEVCI